MSIIKRAFNGLYPEKEIGYEAGLGYSGKFNSYNANIRLYKGRLQINMSRKWKNVDEEIKIGLIQELMNKLFKTGVKTNNIDLYNIFIKKVGSYEKKTKTDPALEGSFDRVNERYFYGLVDRTNFEWCSSKTRIGSYDFGSDTITISRLIKNHSELLDYVMYHEILHKKLKFEKSGGKTRHHTKLFRKKEREFENSEEAERMLRGLARRGFLFGLL